MEPIRVIGRIDLAQQVHAALVAAGADARLATSAPMAVIAATGRDGTGIDVLAAGFDVCPGIKKAAPDRPVVMITWDEPGSDLASAMAASAARTSRGPDAHLPWPATGEQIIAACERARERARVPRPRIGWQNVVVRLAPLVVVALVVWAIRAELQAGQGVAPPIRWPGFVLQLVQTSFFTASAGFSWRRARKSNHPAWHRGWAVFAALFAGLSFVGVVAILLE